MADLDDSDAFSPVKCARRALLNNDAWVTPEKNSQTKSYAADNSLDLMKPCGISPDNDKKALGGLYDAGRSLVVWKEGTKELVPSALCFLAKASNCGSTKICQIISRLFKAAHVLDVATAELRTRKRTTPLGGENLGVFVRSLAVRALDCAIIKSLNSAGFLESEQAGAIFAAGYEKKIPNAKHVTDFLRTQKEWVFGDYVDPMSRLSRRLIQRQLHRVLAALMESKISTKDLKSWVKTKRLAKQWVSSSAGFKKLCEELIAMAISPVQPRTKKSKSSIDENEDEDENEKEDMDDGVSDFGSESDSGASSGGDSDGGASGWDSSGSDAGGEPRILLRDFMRTKEEVATHLSREIEGFDEFASLWTMSQQDLRDLRQEAIEDRVKQLGAGASKGYATIRVAIMYELAKLQNQIRKASKKDGRGGSGGSLNNNNRGQDQSPASMSWDMLRLKKFGAKGEEVSADMIADDPGLASRWNGQRLMWLEHGSECLGAVVSAHGSSKASQGAFTVRGAFTVYECLLAAENNEGAQRYGHLSGNGGTSPSNESGACVVGRQGGGKRGDW